MPDMETVSSVPEIDEKELDREMQEAEQASGGEEREDGGGQPEAEAQPEQGEDKGGAPEGKDPWSYDELRERYDNLNKAFKSERGQRQDLDHWRGQMEERLQHLQAKASPDDRKDDANDKPDRSKDPLAYLDWLDGKVSEYEARETQTQQARERDAQQRQQMQQIQAFGAKAEEEIRADKADYDAAARFFATSRLNELQAVYGMTPQAAQEYFGQELQATVIQNARQGQNPAAAIYAAAHARGYTKQSGEAQATLNQMEAGRKSSPTMPQGGKGKTNAISMDELLKIDDPKEFEKRWAEAEKQGAFAR